MAIAASARARMRDPNSPVTLPSSVKTYSLHKGEGWHLTPINYHVIPEANMMYLCIAFKYIFLLICEIFGESAISIKDADVMSSFLT